jgi:hypothetical protein
MMKDVAAHGGIAIAGAGAADTLRAEWKLGLRRLHFLRSHRTQLGARPATAEDQLVRLDPLVAVRWRGSR